MPLTITADHSAEYADRMEEATNAGLKAAAYVYYNEVKRALAGGYTSGDFVTGRVLNSVTVGDVQDHAIDVGTDVMYALYWEIGHHNIFTRKYRAGRDLAAGTGRGAGRDVGRVRRRRARLPRTGGAMTQVASTNDVYATLISRIANYVPSGTNPEMPATPLSSSTYCGGRIWVTQPKDAPTFPYIVIRLGRRKPDLATHGLMTQCELEVKAFNRPRNKDAQQLLQTIADQIEAALTDYAEPTAPIKCRGMSMRDTIYYSTAPADRDVVLELMSFTLLMADWYLTTELGR